MRHWDMFNKENSVLICSPVWLFVPRDRSAAKGPLLGSILGSSYTFWGWEPRKLHNVMIRAAL